jgi:hypothetical protein
MKGEEQVKDGRVKEEQPGEGGGERGRDQVMREG